ncbi:MAG: hypothetical protein R3C05_17285 [Pirellulaceae bacterium]
MCQRLPFSEVGVDDSTELETSAPFAATMQSIRIRIRLEDAQSREIL